MNFKASVTPKKSDDTKKLFTFKFKTYKDEIEGDFEESELRHLIEIIDNAI